MTQPEKPQQNLPKPKKSNAVKWIAVIVILVVIVAGIVIGITTYHPTTKKLVLASPLVYSNTKYALTGEAISFTLENVTTNVTNVTWNFGDGTVGYGTSTSHAYANAGNYLVEVTYTSGGSQASNTEHLYPITVSRNTAGVNSTLAAEQTNPVILFNTTINPNAPIFEVSQTIHAIAGFLEPPTAKGWNITAYRWSFNGVVANGVYFNVSANTSGLMPMILNITTSNSVSSISNIFVESIFVHNTSTPAAVLKGPGSVLNPGTITNAEVVPGGPYALDPQIDWETVGMEVIRNVYQTLVAYNGTSTTSFIPVLATNIPTVANGEISPNQLNWTFYIRNNAYFADGHKVTVFDVYFSLVRELLFTTGSPGTGGYTLAQALLPGYANDTPGFNDYYNITRAITYDNATQSITFHLFKPVPYFLDLLADTPSSVMEESWAAAHGAGITWTPAGFNAYMQEGDASDYNSYLLWHTMGSGPFTVSLVQQGESITLTPNPYYVPPPYGFPKSNYTVVLDYVKEASTAVLMLEDGQADIVSNLPTSSLPSIQTLVSNGKVNTYTFPTMTTYFYPFNFDINITMLHSIGSSYSIPSTYFANLYVRKAFVDAFNYSEFINDILGNSIYHMTLGSPYVGLLVGGMLGYKNYSDWLNAPTYNLQQAKLYLEESGYFNTTVNFPMFVQSGDTTNYAAMSMWAAALHSIDPHITATPIYITFDQMIAYTAAGQNPMPIYDLGWGTSIPDPINMIPPMYVPGGFYMSADGVPSASALTAMGYPQEAQNFSEIENLSDEAATNPNSTQRAMEYQEANQIAINMTLYLYTYIPSGMWIYQSWMKGVAYEENPVVGGEVDTLYCYLSK
ncbi:MAG: ABC transporter substrate-binding protein [Candidatus Parvarchaeota archaeon]